MKYTGAAYDHENSTGGQNGGKSPAPKNGSKSLEDSIPFKEKGNQNLERRLGVEEDHYVIFDEQSPGEFHGHIKPWEELTDDMKDVLYEAGIIKNRKSGKR